MTYRVRSISGDVFVAALAITLAVGLGSAVQSCGGVTPAPASLSSTGVLAFNQTRAIKALDLIRDTAILANAQTPSALSTTSTRLVVQFHEATVKTINAAGTGWPTLAQTAADNFIKTLPAADQAVIQPYITLLDTLLGSF
jgi:hypothetical protein